MGASCRFAQDEHELHLRQMRADPPGPRWAFKVVGALFAGRRIGRGISKPSGVVVLASESIQLIDQKELWVRPRRLRHEHVRVSIEQFVQPCRSGARSAGNAKGWSLSWHVPEGNVRVDRIGPNVTIQGL